MVKNERRMTKLKHKKIWAIVTLVCFLFTLMPVAAFAENVVVQGPYSDGMVVTLGYGEKPENIEGFVWVLEDESACSDGLLHSHSDGCYELICDHKDGHTSNCYSESTAYALCSHSDESQHTGSVTLADVVTIDGSNVSWKVEHPAYGAVYAVYKVAYDEAYDSAKYFKEIAAKAAGVAALVGKTFCYTTTSAPDECEHVCSAVGGACYGLKPALNHTALNHEQHSIDCQYSKWTLYADVNGNGTADKDEQKYTIKYVNGEKVLQESAHLVDTAYPAYKGEVPTKEADAQYTYTFSGWSGWSDEAPETVTADVTHTAQFNATVNTYTVTWKNDDGTVLETDQDVPYGTVVSYDGETPTKASDTEYTYAFSGWAPEVTADTIVTGNMVFNATFSTEEIFDVVYNVEGATATKYVVNGETAEVYAPTKEYYNLDGWYTDSACTVKFDFATLITADTQLYAKWNPVNDVNNDGIADEEQGCQVTVNGDVTFTVTGNQVPGETITITAMPGEGKYVAGVTVNDAAYTGDIVFEAGEATFSYTLPAGSAAGYVFNVATAPIISVPSPAAINYNKTMSATQAEVALKDIITVAEGIEKSALTIQYDASLTGYKENWKSLDYVASGTNHAFGQSAFLTTETVKINYAGDNVKYQSVELIFEVSLNDARTETSITVNEGATVVYGASADAVKTAIGAKLTVAGSNSPINAELTYGELENLSAGEHKITVSYAGDATHKGSSVEATVTVTKADTTVTINSATVRYDNAGKNVSNMISSDAKVIEFVAGLGLNDGSETAVDTIVYVNLPELIDLDAIPELIKPYVEEILSGVEKNNITIAELKTVLEYVVSALEAVDNIGDVAISTEAIQTLINALDQIEDLDGVGEIKVSLSMGKNVVVNTSGVYLIGALVSDANYETAFDIGYLLITPDGTKVTLDFNIKDENGLITKQAIVSGAYDLGSHVVEDAYAEAAEKVLRNIYLGVDLNGNVYVDNIPSAELGGYTQLAYIHDFGNEMFYAEPIVRAYAVVTDLVTVEFVGATTTVEGAPAYRFTYDGQAHSVDVNVIARDNSVLEKDGLTIRYLGIEGDCEGYYSTVAPTEAGVYSVIATYLNDAQTHMGMGIATMAIAPSMEAEIGVENAMHTYDGNAVDINELISKTPGAAHVVMTAGIGAVNSDSDVLDDITGVINIDFPARVDNVLKNSKLFDDAYGAGMGIDKAIDALEKVANAMSAEGYEAADMNNLVAVLTQLNNNVKVTFKEQAEVNPTAVGTYLVVASILDPNYVPELGAGLVVIAPEVTKAKLYWTVDDTNGVVTVGAIASGAYELDAFATINNEVSDETSAALQYLVLGVNDEGITLQNLTANALNNAMDNQGIYTEVAYYPTQLENNMTVAAPIMRTLAVVTNAVNITFEDANNNNAFVFNYDGKQHAVTPVVTALDGSAYNTEKGKLTVTYIGAGKDVALYKSTVAPSAIGAYTVVATYVEYAENGEIACVGMAVGAMVIEPADNAFTMGDKEVVYDGAEQFVTVNGTTAYIYAVVDNANKTINIVMSERLTALAKDVKALGEATVADAKEVAEALKAKIVAGELNAETVAAIGALATVVDKVQEKVEAEVEHIEYTVVFNQSKPIAVGTYEVYAMSYGEYVKPVFAQATLTIYDVTVAVEPTVLTLKESETAALTATVTVEPADVNVDTTVTWKSSNESVATVDANGVVTAVSAGRAIITATAAGKSASCEVTVNAKPQEVVRVTGVTLDNETITLIAAGETQTLTATVEPSDATDKSVIWTSSNPEVATVVNGVVTAVANGEAIITVTTANGGYTDTCTVTVNIPTGTVTVPVTGVALDKDTLSLKVGNTAALTATVAPDNATNKAVTWASSDESVATVANGVVTAVAKGTATITVTTVDGSFTDTCAVTVTTSGGGSSGGAGGGGGFGGGGSSSTATEYTHNAFIGGYPDGTFGPDKQITRGEVAAIFARLLADQKVPGKVYTNNFSDVPSTLWSAESIGFMQSLGMLGGYPDDTFRPEQPITRAELVAIVCRFKAAVPGVPVFNDVPMAHWAINDINAAAAQKWVGGYEDGSFRPERPITRAEVVSILCRVMERNADVGYITSNYAALANTFTDVRVTHWAYWNIMEAAIAHDCKVMDNEESWEEVKK